MDFLYSLSIEIERDFYGGVRVWNTVYIIYPGGDLRPASDESLQY